MRRWIVAMMVLGAGCNGDGTEAPRCTLIGCDSGAGFKLGTFLEADFTRLTGARVEVCINSTCGAGVITMLPGPSDETTVRLQQPLDPRMEVSLSRVANGPIDIRIAVASDEPELFADGDVYTATLDESGGARLAMKRWSVSYRTSMPNGPDCEPTCRSAIDVTEL